MNEEENSTEVVFFLLDGGREWWVLVDGVLGGGFTSSFLFCIQNEGKERFIQPGICAQGGQSQCLSEQGSATVCLTQFEYFNGGISQC